jgi:hypothetical protein
MIAVELIAATLTGSVVGTAVTIRMMPWYISRLPKAEQIAFAKRVGKLRGETT